MPERFWAKVNKTDTCWLWTGALDSFGYGRIFKPGRKQSYVTAHRYSAMLHFGMFDRRLLALHHCDNPSCVNPDHLYVGTSLDNNRDMVSRGRNANLLKTTCKHGHVFDERNTKIRTDGSRRCRKCDAIRHQRKREKRE